MGSKIRKNNLLAFFLASCSCVFLFLSGSTGVSGLIAIEEIVFKYANIPYLNLLFILALVFASFGGITVLFGGVLILKNKATWGDLLIGLGSGAGAIGFLFNLFISFNTLNISVVPNLSYSSLGVICALLAQFISRNEKKKKK